MCNSIQNKIDFAIVINVKHANPNGDPLNANRPRQTIDRLGEISDVCLKRKLRNRLLAMGEQIFVQSDDNRVDDYRSLKARFDAFQETINGDLRMAVNERWFDVRAFGQVFAFGDEGAGAVSIGIRGPVTIQSAYSLLPIIPESIQITKSVNLQTNDSDPDKKDADTMGMKHRVPDAIYVAFGAITPQLALRTGFSEEDADKIQTALRSLFEGDASSARPEGSMEVLSVIWCSHNSPCGQYSSAKVHRAIKAELDKSKDGTFDIEKIRESLSGLQIEKFGQLEGDELNRLLEACEAAPNSQE